MTKVPPSCHGSPWTAWIGWTSDADDQVRVPIRDGHVTQASAAGPEWRSANGLCAADDCVTFAA